MTKKQALKILIKNSAANAAGVGVGLKDAEWTSFRNQENVRQAIAKLWVDAYGKGEQINFSRFGL